MDSFNELLNSEMSNRIANALSELAQGLGVAAEHVYIIIVRQMMVEGIVDVSICLALGIVGFFGLRSLWKKALAMKFNHNEPTKEFSIVGVGVSTLALFIFIISRLPEALMKTFNPEFYAIKMIMEMVAGS